MSKHKCEGIKFATKLRIPKIWYRFQRRRRRSS